jgi:sporulation protein YlmC with PRC-barrel domain
MASYSTTNTTSGGAKIIGGDHTDAGPGPEVMSADTLCGDNVVKAEGEELGEVTEIMLDVPSGRIAYAVMSCGGFLGMGDKLFAIPWSALTLDAERKCFVLNIDKERLENAPGFDKGKWPAMADMKWATEVHSYYGVRPYWERDPLSRLQ